MALESLVFLSLVIIGTKADVCPKQCDCDMENGLKRAICQNQNIISVDIGVPSYVEVYDLHSNAISELDNYSFKNAGYTSLTFINLSYNRIFWIGLHAFSGLTRLLHLDLSNNRLRAIASDLLWSTPLLEYLDLSGNVFETLKNEPFLMHTALKVLNLSSCRITALPLRMFTRLPNLRKLDLSDNYMIGFQVPVLIPLKKLERLELRNEYWKCIPEFITVESWIISHKIDYERQCVKKMPKMFEKMVSILSSEAREDIDIDKVWNVTGEVAVNATGSTEKPRGRPTFFQRFDEEFPSLWALLVGLEIGLVVGVTGTYIWLRSLCSCGALRCTRPESPHRRRRLRRLRDEELRAHLLWSAAAQAESPPSHRRRPEPAEGGAARGTGGEAAARADTPPPPYNECHGHRLCV